MTRSDGTDLLQILLFRRILLREQAERARRSARANNAELIPTIVSLGFANEVQIGEAVAEFTGVLFVKLNPLELDLDIVTGGLSAAFPRRHGLVAISKTATTVTIAVHDPFAPFPADDIRRVTGLDVQRVVAIRTDIEAITANFYGLRSSLKSAEKQLSARSILDLGNQEFLSAQADELDPTSISSRSAMPQSCGCASTGCCTTCICCRALSIRQSCRASSCCPACDIAERRRPQDGRIKRDQHGREIELRVSTMPTAFGEKAVLRIFDPDVLLKDVDQLGFSSNDLQVFERFLTRPHGIILVTGPTGSGKTTTLYSVLKRLSKPEEHHHDRGSDRDGAGRFESGCGASRHRHHVCKRAPNRAPLGSRHHHGGRDSRHGNRGKCSARRAHRTPRALDTPHQRRTFVRHSAPRPPHCAFPVLSTVIGIVAQRLVRVNCPHCSEPYAPAPGEIESLGVAAEQLAAATLRRGTGCLHRRQTGYAGRDGVFQIMPMSERVRGVIARHGTSLEILGEAKREGMRTLREAAAEKVLAGTTTVAEMLRVAGT